MTPYDPCCRTDGLGLVFTALVVVGALALAVVCILYVIGALL